MNDLSPVTSAEEATTTAEAMTPPQLATTPPAPSGKVKAAAKPDTSSLGITFDDTTPGVQKVRLSRDDILCSLFHTKDPAQASNLLAHCLTVVRTDEGGEGNGVRDHRGFMVSAVRDLAPRDIVERMLAVQMAATHVAMVRAARRMAGAELLPQLEAHTTAYNKLARTYTAQMEALRKHRDGGKQKVTVEHVHVHPGGQAVVGDVHHGGRGAKDGK